MRIYPTDQILELKTVHVLLEAEHALTEADHGGCTDVIRVFLFEQRLEALERRMRLTREKVAVLTARRDVIDLRDV